MSNRFFLSVVAFSFFLTACGGSGNNSTTQIAYEATPIQEGGGDQGTTDGGQGTTVDGGQGTTDGGQGTTDGGQGTTNENEEVIDIIVEQPDPEEEPEPEEDNQENEEVIDIIVEQPDPTFIPQDKEKPTHSTHSAHSVQITPAPQQTLERTKGTLHGRHGIGLFGYWLEVIPINDVITARARLNNFRSDTDLIEYSKKRDGTFPEFHLDNMPVGHVGAFPGTISGTYGGRFVGSYYYKGEAGHFDSDAELKIVLKKTGNSYQAGTIEGFLGNDITMAGDDFYGFIIGASFDTEKGGFEVTRGSQLTGKARFDTNLQFGTGTWTDVYEVFTKTDEGTCSNSCIEATYGKPDNFDEENNQNHKIVTRFITGGLPSKNYAEGSIRGWTSEDGGLFSFPNDLYGEVKVKGFSREFNSKQVKEYKEDLKKLSAEELSAEEFSEKYSDDFRDKINKHIDHNLHGVFVTTLEEDTVPGG